MNVLRHPKAVVMRAVQAPRGPIEKLSSLSGRFLVLWGLTRV